MFAWFIYLFYSFYLSSHSYFQKETYSQQFSSYCL